MKNYKVSVDDFEFELQSPHLDVIQVEKGGFHILHNQKSFQAKVLSQNPADKTLIIDINGNNYEVEIADKYDQLVTQLGLSSSSHQKVNDVKAPMPGLVLEVAIAVGQKVKKGDGLLILEAMKMENVIKSTGDGVVKSIHIEKGAAVDKGQLLIEME